MKKLTRQLWEKLDAQYEKTPTLAESYRPSGEHYLLLAILNEFGYYPNDRAETINLAEVLLANGYE